MKDSMNDKEQDDFDFLHSAGMPTMIPWRGSDFRGSNYKMIRARLPPPLL